MSAPPTLPPKVSILSKLYETTCNVNNPLWWSACTRSGMLALCCTAVVLCCSTWRQQRNEALKCLCCLPGTPDELWQAVFTILKGADTAEFPAAWRSTKTLVPLSKFVHVACHWGMEELLSPWTRGKLDLSGESDRVLAWRSDCQKGNIKSAEVELSPAQSSSSKKKYD